MTNPLIQQLSTRRKALQEQLDGIIATADRFGRQKLSSGETARFNEIDEELKALDGRLDGLRKQEDRVDAAARVIAANGGVERANRSGTVSRVYTPDGPNSYFLDLAKRQFLGDWDAATRLNTYAEEQRVNPNRTDGTGGYGVPPLWVMEEYVQLARAGRPFADNVRKMALPGGTDSINLPKMATGTTVAVQTADAAAVSSTDITDTTVSSNVATVAGMQDISMQLLEQSPIGFDQILLGDLARALAVQIDTQCLAGSGVSGQVQGINGLSGSNSITFTSGAPTGALLYLPLAQAIDAVAAGIYMPPTAIWMHPRRWFWLASQLDSSSRPLVVPYAQGPYNALASQGAVAAQGPCGSILGIDCFLDANIGVTYGAGSNEDRIYVCRMDQIFLWESEPRPRVMQEVLSGALQCRVQLYEYYAYICGRLPKAISVISGTGLTAPAGFA